MKSVFGWRVNSKQSCQIRTRETLALELLSLTRSGIISVNSVNKLSLIHMLFLRHKELILECFTLLHFSLFMDYILKVRYWFLFPVCCHLTSHLRLFWFLSSGGNSCFNANLNQIFKFFFLERHREVGSWASRSEHTSERNKRSLWNRVP